MRGFPAEGIAGDPDASVAATAEDGGMTYAVVWRENEGETFAGLLELTPGYLVLSGTAAGVRESERKLRYTELSDAHLERRRGPLLVLVGPHGTRVEVASLEGTGALHELVEELELVRGKAAD
jgi:hypothetical protein